MRITAFILTVGFCLSSAQPADAGFKAVLQNTSSNFDGTTISGYVGRIDWKQNNATDVPWISHAFSSFCIERDANIYFGRAYNFQTKTLGSSPVPGTGMGTASANDIRRLWSNQFNQLGVTDISVTHREKNAAFQIAIWRILDNTFFTNSMYLDQSANVKNLANSYYNGRTNGTFANLVALTSGTAPGSVNFQDQIVEVKSGCYVDGKGEVQPTPAPAAILLAIFGCGSFLGLRRLMRSPVSPI